MHEKERVHDAGDTIHGPAETLGEVADRRDDERPPMSAPADDGPIRRVLDALDAAGKTYRTRGRQTEAQCPAHDDTRASLGVWDSGERVALWCQAGCDTRDVIGALGLGWRDLYAHANGRDLAVYDYGSFRVHRGDAKRFRQSGDTGRKILYRLERVQAAVAAGEPVYLVEGEEDVHALESAGVVATTTPQGAKSVARADLSPLAGAHVVAVPDADTSGAGWREDVVRLVGAVAASLSIGAVKAGKDVSDHLAAGHEVTDLDPQPVLLLPSHSNTAPTTGIVGPEPPAEDPFDLHPALIHVRQAAHSRRVTPWAVLGCVLARAVVTTSPGVTLPPVVGTRASLNLLVALTGPSGAGKGGADGCARDLLTTDAAAAPFEVGVGSGEGIAHAFARRGDPKKGEPDEVRVREAALFHAAEVDQLAGAANRRGSTVLPVLRSVWSGETLGQMTADPTRRLRVPAHTYRACLITGVQPARAKPLLDDTDGGTPQRILFATAWRDPTAPRQRPDWPGPLDWQPPPQQQWDIALPDDVWAELDDVRYRVLTEGVEPLDAHLALTRLKVAAALAILDPARTGADRMRVLDDDWHLAGLIIAESVRVREGLRAELHAQAARLNEAAGAAEGRRQDVASQVTAAAAVERVADRARLLLGRHGALSRSELRRRIAQRSRVWLDEAIDALVEQGRAQIVDGERGERIAPA